MPRVAVVTGANKGIGFAVVESLCRRFDGAVYLTSRSEALGRAAVEDLNRLGLYPEYHRLDVTDRDSVLGLRERLAREHGGLDVLVNNAGYANGLFSNSYEEQKKVIDINYRGALTLRELICPLLRNRGRVLHVSSDCGHLSNVRNKHWIERLSRPDLQVRDIDDFVDWFLDAVKAGNFDTGDLVDNGVLAAYRVSKVALSALTMVQQRELAGRDISVNSVHPGLVRTDMTMRVGFRSAAEAAEVLVHLVLEAPSSLRGAYVWHDGTAIDWFDHQADIYFTASFARSWILSSVIVNIRDYVWRWVSYLLERLRP